MAKNKSANFFTRFPLGAFILLTFTLTWMGSLLYVRALDAGSPLTIPGSLLWYYAPFSAGVVVTWASRGKVAVQALLAKLLNWRLNWKWYALVIFYPLAMRGLVLAFSSLVLGLPFRGFFASAFGAEAIPTGSLILTLVTLVLVNFFLRGIGEETGWRGFAASLAGNKRHPILALLLVGGLWALWHIHPANFASILTLSGLFLLLNIAATSIILAWTYLRTESLFLAAVFHMTLNVAEWIMPTGLLNDFHLSRALTQTVLIWLVAVGLLINLAQHPIKETC